MEASVYENQLLIETSVGQPLISNLNASNDPARVTKVDKRFKGLTFDDPMEGRITHKVFFFANPRSGS
jgi:hypothetical protein